MTREKSKEQIPFRKRKSQQERHATQAPFSLQRWLFELFRIVGIEQKDIATRLGVSKTMVSFWANDREPISRRHLEMLHELVFTAVSEASRQARLFHAALFTHLEQKIDHTELRKILAGDTKGLSSSLQQLFFDDEDDLSRQFRFHYEQDGHLQEMRIELSNVVSALCEKVAAEYRAVTNFVEPTPERPLNKMLRMSRETRDALQNGSRSILADVEQLDVLLWFEEAFIRAPARASGDIHQVYTDHGDGVC